MRYAKWIVAAGFSASLGLLTANGMAQGRAEKKEDGDFPRRNALGVAKDADSPKAKGVAAGKDPSKTRPIVSERRAAPEERRETHRLPVTNAHANSTFRSTQLIGTHITDADGQLLGKVVDFVSDARGNILYQFNGN